MVEFLILSFTSYLLQLHIRGVVRHVGTSFVANFLEHTIVKEF